VPQLLTQPETTATVVSALTGVAGVIGLRDEPLPAGAEPLLQPVMRAGRRMGPPESLDAARQRFEADLDALPARSRQLLVSQPMPVSLTDRLWNLRDQTRAAAGGQRVA
jgi:nicotinate phosphoribosyltransferase